MAWDIAAAIGMSVRPFQELRSQCLLHQNWEKHYPLKMAAHGLRKTNMAFLAGKCLK
jgi:hypothetical protein